MQAQRSRPVSGNSDRNRNCKAHLALLLSAEGCVCPLLPLPLAQHLSPGLERLVLAVADVSSSRSPPFGGLILLWWMQSRVSCLTIRNIGRAAIVTAAAVGRACILPVAPTGDSPVDEGLQVFFCQAAAPPQRLLLPCNAVRKAARVYIIEGTNSWE